MKRIVFKIILLIVFLFPLSIFAEEDDFVSDGAKILKKDTVEYMSERSQFLHRNELIDYYVVTVPDIGETSMEEYSDSLFDKYSMLNNGILILVSRGNGLLRVQIGSELGEFISEEQINAYIDNYFTPFIESGDWDLGLKNGYTSFFKVICDHFQYDTSSVVILDKVPFLKKYCDYIVIGLSFVVMIVAYILLKMYKNIFIKRSYNDSILDYLLVALVLIINVSVLVGCYFLRPISVLIVAGVELIALYTFHSNGFDLKRVRSHSTGLVGLSDKEIYEMKKSMERDSEKDNK